MIFYWKNKDVLYILKFAKNNKENSILSLWIFAIIELLNGRKSFYRIFPGQIDWWIF